MSSVIGTRGKKKLNTKEKRLSEQRQKDRVKVANLVSRSKEIDKVCCICGKPAEILHNTQNPYLISFICKDCRNNKDLVNMAKEQRFDIRTKLNKKYLSTKNFTESEVRSIINNYLISNKMIGQYCKDIGITRHQFSRLVEMYDTLYPNKNITQQIDIVKRKQLNQEKRK